MTIMRYQWTGFILLLLLLLMMNPNSSKAMTADHALRLVTAWEGKSGNASQQPAHIVTAANGDFSLRSRGALFRYENAAQRLIVSGFVGQHMESFTVAKEPEEELQAYAAREQVTLGEGQFQIITTPMFDLSPPILLLSKNFTDDKIADAQFVLEVRWLLEWATHWRTQRLSEILSGDSPEIVARQGAEHVDFALKNRPRPW